MSVAFPLLRPVNPVGLRTSQSKVSIEDVDLSKRELRPQPALLRTRPGVEERGGRVPMDNLALRLHPGRLPVRPGAESRRAREPLHNLVLRLRPGRAPVRPGAENRKARELTRSPAVLRAGDRPLAVDKRNQKAERKRASKFLRLPPAFNKASSISR